MTAALARDPARSLYSGMALALIVLAFVLQASFLAGLAAGRGGFAARSDPAQSIIEKVSVPEEPLVAAVPCVNE